jgi:hypothetical protein
VMRLLMPLALADFSAAGQTLLGYYLFLP